MVAGTPLLEAEETTSFAESIWHGKGWTTVWMSTGEVKRLAVTQGDDGEGILLFAA